ncbi:ABC transporter permease [Streptomyces sp. NPDC054887]
MSTTTTPPDTARDTPDGRPPRGPHGLRWVFLRLHRTPLRLALAVIVLGAALTGFLRWAASAYPEKEFDCSDGGPCSDTFLGFHSAATLLYEYVKNLSLASLLLPVLIGAFVAGPVVARELESGLHRLAWTQSVSPARWFASKLAMAATLATAAALAFIGVFHLGGGGMFGMWNLRWPHRGVYEATGPALVAYCLLAVAVGALTGLLVRRTVAAMAATAAATGAVLLGVGTVRWDLIPVNTLTGPGSVENSTPTGLPKDVLVVDWGVQNAAGERFFPSECVPEKLYGARCPSDVTVTDWFVDFHPQAHFWYAQLVESAVALALAAAIVYAALRVLRRRHA